MAAFFLLKAASRLKGGKFKKLQLAFRAIAGLLAAMLLVPYSVNIAFEVVHLALSGLLLLVVVAASIHAVIAFDRRPLNIIILLLELAAIVPLYLSLTGKVHLHGPSELLMSLLFIALMYSTLKETKEQTHN